MKYQDLIQQMTLEEKASLMSGANFWNTKPIERLSVPGMMLTDGPHGVRKQGGKADHLGLNKSIPATCYPPATSIANTWNQALLEEMGRHLGLEAKAMEVSVLLGPGVNIKRSPLCGRNFEYFSEDPYLAGKCGAALIRGIQENGISACVKHFAANSQEHLRMTSDSVMDERTLREIYLPAFEMAVKEGGVKCLMTSYNRLNGEYTNENHHLLQDILLGEWGYDGMVVTDWGGNNDRVEGLKAGCSLEMPSTAGKTDRQIVEAVKNGSLDEAVLDERVDALLNLVFSTREAVSQPTFFDAPTHHAFAAKVAGECAVLLKNEESILPLNSKQKIAVIGDFAKTPRYQGAGSSRIEPTALDNMLSAMKKAGADILGFAPGFRRMGGKSTRLLNQAVELAKKADVALLCLGLDEGSEAEGADRADMKMPDNQLTLLRAVKAVNPSIVVVLSCGSPVEMDWDVDAKAVLHGYLGGQAGANAAADILMGHINPSGKLAETIPMSLADVSSTPYFPGREATAEYREGLYVGYRYFDTAKVTVKYPFGFGLSYTTFAYSDLVCTEDGVDFTITNTGSVSGGETAQVYVSAPKGGVFRPEKELKGFAKVFLAPGESQRVHIALDRRAYAYWNIQLNDWAVEAGEYQILVGASSRDIRLAGSVALAGDTAPNPYEADVFDVYRTGRVHEVSDEAFTAILGHEPPPTLWDPDAPFTFTSPIGQGVCLKGGLGRFLYKLVKFCQDVLFFFGDKENANNLMFAMNLPYRGFARMIECFSEEQIHALVRVVNREKGGWRAFFRAGREKNGH